MRDVTIGPGMDSIRFCTDGDFLLTMPQNVSVVFRNRGGNMLRVPVGAPGKKTALAIRAKAGDTLMLGVEV